MKREREGDILTFVKLSHFLCFKSQVPRNLQGVVSYLLRQSAQGKKKVKFIFSHGMSNVKIVSFLDKWVWGILNAFKKLSVLF